MGEHLIQDEDFRATTFLVLDFETTTPKGHRPEPIEVAAILLRAPRGQLMEMAQFSSLIRPPSHAPITRFDTDQTGITPQMAVHQPPASAVLERLDAKLTEPPYLLVAHNAPTEAGIIYDYRRSCPHLAGTHLLDTVRLAHTVYPDLASYRLDRLMTHLGIARPSDRHRALTDVKITVELFKRLLEDGFHADQWSTLRQLFRIGGYEAKATKPLQEPLFD